MPKVALKKATASSRKQAVKTKPTPKKKKRLIDKKPHLEFIASLLTIPFLVSVLILNYNSIKNLDRASATPTPAPYGTSNGNHSFFAAPIGTVAPKVTQGTSSNTNACDKTLGPISISSPSEGARVTDNPVEVDITYDDSTHCEAVWSYRVNGGSWSDYDNRSIALYNLPQGAVKFELRVKSIASSDSTSLTRNFTYAGQNTVSQPNNASNSAH